MAATGQVDVFDLDALDHVDIFDLTAPDQVDISAFRRGGPATRCKRITSQHHVRKTHETRNVITRQDT